MAGNNNIKGRDLLMEIFVGAVYKTVGGIRTKDFTRDNPVSDATSQSSLGNETEAAFNGYGTVTLSGNGSVDIRDTSALMGYKALATIANSADPTVKLKLSDSQETHEGNFLITSFGKSTEQNGLVEFSIALQNCDTITYT